MRDLNITLPRLVETLRPNGTLVVVDNVAFGLVRSTAQAAQAESSQAEFEHYRNLSAAQAEALLDGPELELLQQVEVSPERSNQWLLVYKKRGPSPAIGCSP